MNELYVPKDTTPPFRAAQWEYDQTDKVANFLKLLIDHNLTFSFDSNYDSSYVEVDIRIPREARQPMLITVENLNWFAIIDGAHEVFTDYEFNQKFRKA